MMTAPLTNSQNLLLQSGRWKRWEYAMWALALALPLVLPRHTLIINEIAIVALFALALDLILGYTGIVSLGHAAFFGMGAYSAALFAKLVMPDPLLGLLVGIAAAGALGAVCSATILRGTDLTRLMVTLGVGLILMELANKLDWLTGGADGLQGVVMGPLLGKFEFDLSGTTTEEIYKLVIAGDVVAINVWNDATAAMARACELLITILSPEVIVFGGGLSNAGETFLKPIRDYLDSSLTFQRMPRLEIAHYGAKAGTIGCAMLAFDRVKAGK